MHSNKYVGHKGEFHVSQHLERTGANILSRNFRCSRCEIDIIAERSGNIYFIEVKTRTNSAFGYPELAVTKRKILRIQKVADHFLSIHHFTNYECYYMIAAVTLQKHGAPVIEFFEI